MKIFHIVQARALSKRMYSFNCPLNCKHILKMADSAGMLSPSKHWLVWADPFSWHCQLISCCSKSMSICECGIISKKIFHFCWILLNYQFICHLIRFSQKIIDFFACTVATFNTAVLTQKTSTYTGHNAELWFLAKCCQIDVKQLFFKTALQFIFQFADLHHSWDVALYLMCPYVFNNK